MYNQPSPGRMSPTPQRRRGMFEQCLVLFPRKTREPPGHGRYSSPPTSSWSGHKGNNQNVVQIVGRSKRKTEAQTGWVKWSCPFLWPPRGIMYKFVQEIWHHTYTAHNSDSFSRTYLDHRYAFPRRRLHLCLDYFCWIHDLIMGEEKRLVNFGEFYWLLK